MKLFLPLCLLLTAVPALALDSSTTADASQRVDDLRRQLIEVQTKEADLQARVKQLDEDIKPENIERSLAGVGSTKPEELREHRRRQLGIERDGIRNQLKLLSASRERLEAAIRTAEGLAYQQSAEVTGSPISQALVAQNASSYRWALVGLGVVTLGGLGFALAIKRRRSTRS